MVTKFNSIFGRIEKWKKAQKKISSLKHREADENTEKTIRVMETQ